MPVLGVMRARTPRPRARPARAPGPGSRPCPGRRRPGRLELRLDQEDQVGAGRRHRAGQGGHDAAQRDEATGRPPPGARLEGGVGRRELGHGEGADVGALEDASPRGRARRRRVELPVADVDGVDVGRAALEQAVGEAAGRGAGIEGAPAGDGDGEAVQCGLELVATAADVGRRRARGATTGSSGATRRAGLSAGARRRARRRPRRRAWASCRESTRPRRTSSASSRRRAPLLSWRPSWTPSRWPRRPSCRGTSWPGGLRRRAGRAGVLMPGSRDGATLVAASWARVAVLPRLCGHVLGGLAGLRRDALGRLARLVGGVLGRLAGLAGVVLGGLAGLLVCAAWPSSRPAW